MIYFLGTIIKKLSLFFISMSALGFSFIDSNESKNIEQTTKKHCRTLRKRHKKKSSKIDNLLNSLSVTQQQMKESFPGDRGIISRREDDDEDRDLSNFEPLAPAQNQVSKDSYNDTISRPVDEDEEAPVTRENFAQLGEVTSADYYKQYVPYYSQLQGSPEEVHTNKDALMTKLNYMIHLLEEQQDEKTDNVTEELVLYLFLGVFVIFVVDSFARAGKYTR